jgi:hypothetical protein
MSGMGIEFDEDVPTTKVSESKEVELDLPEVPTSELLPMAPTTPIQSPVKPATATETRRAALA